MALPLLLLGGVLLSDAQLVLELCSRAHAARRFRMMPCAASACCHAPLRHECPDDVAERTPRSTRCADASAKGMRGAPVDVWRSCCCNSRFLRVAASCSRPAPPVPRAQMADGALTVAGEREQQRRARRALTRENSARSSASCISSLLRAATIADMQAAALPPYRRVGHDCTPQCRDAQPTPTLGNGGGLQVPLFSGMCRTMARSPLRE